MADDNVAMPPAETAGVSVETHNAVKDELTRLREQNAMLKVKQEGYDAQKREALAGMKADVNDFISRIVQDERNAPYKHELAPMTRWAGDMDTAETVDTNLSIGRLISCASAKFKHSTEEASQLKEKSELVAQKSKRVEELEEDNAKKTARITELTGLLEERTAAATKMGEELARAGLMQEKIDFSRRAARENVEEGASVGSSSKAAGKQPMAAARAPNMDDALFSFLSGGRGSGKRITPSGTGHALVGAATTSNDDIASAIAAA